MTEDIPPNTFEEDRETWVRALEAAKAKAATTEHRGLEWIVAAAKEIGAVCQAVEAIALLRELRADETPDIVRRIINNGEFPDAERLIRAVEGEPEPAKPVMRGN